MPCSYVFAACKHTHHEYKAYIDLVYKLKSVSNVYRVLFGELCNKAYWSQCHEPPLYPNPKMLRPSSILLYTHRNGYERTE